jgi:hypothetical protein
MEYDSDRPDVTEVPLEMADAPDLAVAIELTDSLDAFLLNVKSDCLLLSVDGAADGRRAGKAGDSDGRLAGSAGLCRDCVDVLGGRAGRDIPSMPFAEGLGEPPSGRLLIPPFDTGA